MSARPALSAARRPTLNEVLAAGVQRQAAVAPTGVGDGPRGVVLDALSLVEGVPMPDDRNFLSWGFPSIEKARGTAPAYLQWRPTQRQGETAAEFQSRMARWQQRYDRAVARLDAQLAIDRDHPWFAPLMPGATLPATPAERAQQEQAMQAWYRGPEWTVRERQLRERARLWMVGTLSYPLVLLMGIVASPESPQRAQDLEAMEVFLRLPDEIVYSDAAMSIFLALRREDCRQVGRLCALDRPLSELCRDPGFWKLLCEKNGWDDVPLANGEAWRDRFIQRCQRGTAGLLPRTVSAPRHPSEELAFDARVVMSYLMMFISALVIVSPDVPQPDGGAAPLLSVLLGMGVSEPYLYDYITDRLSVLLSDPAKLASCFALVFMTTVYGSSVQMRYEQHERETRRLLEQRGLT